MIIPTSFRNNAGLAPYPFAAAVGAHIREERQLLALGRGCYHDACAALLRRAECLDFSRSVRNRVQHDYGLKRVAVRHLLLELGLVLIVELVIAVRNVCSWRVAESCHFAIV